MRSNPFLPALFVPTLAAALLCAPVQAEAPLPGHFRLSAGPDVAGELVLLEDGSFEYFLAAGALDEQAAGRWEQRGEAICLFTDPKPVAPVFSRAEPVAPADDADEHQPTLLVTWPDGSGIAGIDFRIGFAQGEPIEDYTQSYGWTMPEDDPRTPLWIEVSEPMHGLTSPRFDLTQQDHGTLRIVLTPNDLGVVDFEGACLGATDTGVVLYRKEGTLRFTRIAGGGDGGD